MMKIRLTVLCLLLVSVLMPAEANLVEINPDFANGLSGWELYGNDKALIKMGDKEGPGGKNCAVVPTGHASISQGVLLNPHRLYDLTFKFKQSSPTVTGRLVFFYNKVKGPNANAGVTTTLFPHGKTASSQGWSVFHGILKSPGDTVAGKLILSADGLGEMRFAEVVLTELPDDTKAVADIASTDLSYLPTIRTKAPLFSDLLSDQPGGHTVIEWTHNLNKANLPTDMAARYTDEQWKAEMTGSFEDAGASHMYLYWLPGHRDDAAGLYKTYGIKFDVSCETSAVPAAAIKLGAEVLNPIASSTTATDKKVSLVDPAYVQAAKDVIVKLGTEFKGQPYVFMFQGKDEPSVAIPEGPVSTWGPFGKQCAKEVLNDFGYGKYAMPAPDDPAFVKDTANEPFRWIAFNRWMAQKYADSKKVMREALKSVDPAAKYNVCDFWFMSGFTPYDFARMGEYSDIVECDPYASSGEKQLGRGLYNHGFGPKFLGDISGRPVRSVVQAFDYAGYEMTPDDLLEWVSQSLRAGAQHISYYQMDNPKYTDPDRWKMMLYISKLVTEMNAIKLPTDPEVAILYSSDSNRADGGSAKANELYTAYSYLGERVGSWFDFVDDDSLARGTKSLAKYKAVYIPYGKYERQSIVTMLEKYVKEGGTVISGDPEVFSFAPDGSELSKKRREIFGIKVVGAKSRERMVVSKSDWTGKTAGQTLPVYKPTDRGGWYADNGVAVKTARKGVQVLAKFEDGSPALTVANYGKGKAIYFAANPFVPASLCEGAGWESLFRALQTHLGAKTDRPIWRFKLPSPKE